MRSVVSFFMCEFFIFCFTCPSVHIVLYSSLFQAGSGLTGITCQKHKIVSDPYKLYLKLATTLSNSITPETQISILGWRPVGKFVYTDYQFYRLKLRSSWNLKQDQKWV